MKLFLIIIYYSLIADQVFGQSPVANIPIKKEEASSEMKEFSDGNYLQIDEIDIPEGLSRIEDQLRENVIDVIIHSKTHMPIFAQKRPEGYSANYKKFHGMNVRILPLKDEEDFYSLKLFYFNWTTNKFDKNLTRKISKYNVLNELRMATYEILLGKQWVVDNKEKIESRNFDRILAVRQVIDQNARLKKKKDREELKKQEMEEEAEEIKRERRLIKREDKLKKDKKKNEEQSQNQEQNIESTSSENSEKTNENDVELVALAPSENSKQVSGNKKLSSQAKINKTPNPAEAEDGVVPPLPFEIPVPDNGPPKKSLFYGIANYFQESTEVKGLIATKTDLKYIGVGGTFILEKETIPYPTGMRFSIQAAMPIFKEKYSFPIYRSIESEYFVSKIFSHVRFFAGLDFVPLYFVTLPSEGLGLQVYENDFLWAKAGLGLDGHVFDHSYELRLTYLKSIVMKSNQTDKFSATKTQASSYLQIHKSHGAEIAFSTTAATGAFEVSSSKIGISYIYKFEN